uniref:non-specific serine/threonine protein kinase n=1 Tax=Tetradesmus obliquus TaxID=3088 RepID=A0A383VCA4_TETOB|eukprot:jgi/Sobl393_1/19303/SZX78672.1
MGICSSAPVGDGPDEPQPAGPRGNYGTANTARHPSKQGGREPSSHGAAARSASRKQQQNQPAAGGGDRASGKSVLGRCDDMRALYTFDKVLGKGQFGVTRLVTDNVTGEQCACKSISKRKLVSAEDMEDVRREIKVMHHLSGHPHVVTFKGAYEDAHHIHIVMELCTGGELFEQLSAKGHYRERDAASIMRTLLQVVQHCHSMNVVHRDLKPENFLFKDTGKRTLKAIDFGLSTFYTEGSVLRDLVGSPFYMAPEVLRRSYGKAADIWSCGVIMYIMLCGWPPFYGSNAQQIFRAVLHDSLDLASPPWDSVSAQAKDCVRRMLVHDPRKRPDAATILGHEWMQGGSSAPEAPMQPEILQRMRRFANMNRFKKEALRVVATHLPPEEIEGIRQMFMDMDRDGSGTISYMELKEGLRRKGAVVADHELERIMAQVDLDGNHTLDFQEFLTATVFLGKLQRRENLMAAFQHFDTDGSGFISEEELLEALQKEGVSAAAIQSLLSEVDRDNNCRIDYDEFARMMLTEAFDHDRHGSRYSGDGHGAPGQHHHQHLRATRETSNSPRAAGSSGSSGNTNRGGSHAELPGSTGAANEAAMRHLQHMESQALHTLHGVKSGAWQARATELAWEGEGESYSTQVSNAGGT